MGRCKQKQRRLRGLLCRWPSITVWGMYITAQGCRLRNDLLCVEWDVKHHYTISYHTINTVIAISHPNTAEIGDLYETLLQHIAGSNKLSCVCVQWTRPVKTHTRTQCRQLTLSTRMSHRSQTDLLPEVSHICTRLVGCSSSRLSYS